MKKKVTRRGLRLWVLICVALIVVFGSTVSVSAYTCEACNWHDDFTIECEGTVYDSNIDTDPPYHYFVAYGSPINCYMHYVRVYNVFICNNCYHQNFFSVVHYCEIDHGSAYCPIGDQDICQF